MATNHTRTNSMGYKSSRPMLIISISPIQFINLLSDRGFAGEAHLIVNHLSARIEEYKGRHSSYSVSASCRSPYRR
jgi:hypothetical protein